MFVTLQLSIIYDTQGPRKRGLKAHRSYCSLFLVRGYQKAGKAQPLSKINFSQQRKYHGFLSKTFFYDTPV